MRFPVLAGTVAAVVLFAAVPASADVRLTMSNGHVTLTANNATIAQILAEWARVGQTRIVNAERLPGAPITIELHDVPEAQALDTVLRTASGYLAAPRATEIPNASHFDRIFVLPTSTPARTAPAPQTAVFQPAAAGADDDSDPDAPPGRPSVPAPVARPPAPNRGPVFNQFPQPAPPQPDPPPAAQQAPPVVYQPSDAPAGASAPGMIVPAPGQPGQPQPGR